MRSFVACLCWIILTPAATAQVTLNPIEFNAVLSQSSWSSLDLVRDSFTPKSWEYKPGRESGRDSATASKSSRRSTQFSPAGTSSALDRLVYAYPQASRSSIRATFEQLLDGYAKIEQQFNVPRNDVAGAVAAFIAGSYMAYHDVDFPDEHFKPLVMQIHRTISVDPQFAKASNAEKQELYEQMAIVGMFLATTQMALKVKPNPQVAAAMKQAAKGYLEQFLKTDADRVEISGHGLVLR